MPNEIYTKEKVSDLHLRHYLWLEMSEHYLYLKYGQW